VPLRGCSLILVKLVEWSLKQRTSFAFFSKDGKSRVFCFTFLKDLNLEDVCLLDELYQIVVYMPEDMPFNCRICCPVRPSPWETVVRQEMQNGMRDVVDALINSHSSILLQPITQPVSTSP